MKPSLRLRFWLRMIDVSVWFGWHPFSMFVVGRASAATEWGDEPCGDPSAEAAF